MGTLSPATIRIVKSTAPVLVQQGLAITTRMYERLFVDPEIRALFDPTTQASGEQARRFAAAIVAFAQHVDSPSALEAAIERVTARHVSAHVRADHYAAVAAALLPAIQDVLGEAATEDVIQAWGEAYWLLASVLIAREEALYAQAEVAAPVA